jgi:hypothetical protein
MSAVLPLLVKPPEGGRVDLVISFLENPRLRLHKGVNQNCPPLKTYFNLHDTDLKNRAPSYLHQRPVDTSIELPSSKVT